MKRFRSFVFSVLCLAFLVGCDSASMPEEMPEDFSFALTWGNYGACSYDSLTGKLVKTTHATHPEDYVTEYHLPDDLKNQIYGIIRELDPYDYPDLYEPKDKGVLTEATMPLNLVVRANEAEKRVHVENIAGMHASRDKKAQKLFAASKAIETILVTSEPWNALPEEEFSYD